MSVVTKDRVIDEAMRDRIRKKIFSFVKTLF